MSAKPKIRPATSADIASMLALEQAAPSAAHWAEQTYQAMFDADAPPRIALVAEFEGNLCAFAIARLSPDECELENIVVEEAQRRRGIGHMLLRALIAAVREKKAAHLLLEVRESNHAARALYEGCGFTLSSRRRNYYANPSEDALTYNLAL